MFSHVGRSAKADTNSQNPQTELTTISKRDSNRLISTITTYLQTRTPKAFEAYRDAVFQAYGYYPILTHRQRENVRLESLNESQRISERKRIRKKMKHAYTRYANTGEPDWYNRFLESHNDLKVLALEGGVRV